MDFTNSIKHFLETDSQQFNVLLDQLGLERDTVLATLASSSSNSNNNISCSDNSYHFIYLEQAASFLALSFDKLCKSSPSSSTAHKQPIEQQQIFLESFQRLNINAPPIGKFIKCAINRQGSHILLVHDKSLQAIELPAKWGKHNQFDGGKKSIICKSIKFKLNTKLSVVDAIWHRRGTDDAFMRQEAIVCLTDDNMLRFFSSKSPPPHVTLKEIHLRSAYGSQGGTTPSKSMITMMTATTASGGNRSAVGGSNGSDSRGRSRPICIDMGSLFEYNNQLAFPIYILRSNGQVECVIEYHSSSYHSNYYNSSSKKQFDYLGSLNLVPYCMDHDENDEGDEQQQQQQPKPQVVSFMCMPSNPNCVIILLTTGTIHHCLFMPTAGSSSRSSEANSNSLLFESQNDLLVEDESCNSSSDAILFVYESVKLFNDEIISPEMDLDHISAGTIRLLEDKSNEARYFVCHSIGIHSVQLPWLNNLRSLYKASEKETTSGSSIGLDEFDQTKLCEIRHLISTRPFPVTKTTNKKSPHSQSLIGSTVLYDFGVTSPMIIAFNTDFRFVCVSLSQRQEDEEAEEEEKSELTEEEQQQKEEEGDDKKSNNNNLFTSFVVNLLKREANMPALRTTGTGTDGDNLTLSDQELHLFANNSINLIKCEFIERQKRVVHEFQKRRKLLKQTEQQQVNMVHEVNESVSQLSSDKQALALRLVELEANRVRMEQTIENTLHKLMTSSKRKNAPLNDDEAKIYDELRAFKSNLKEFRGQMNESKMQLQNQGQQKLQSEQQNNDQQQKFEDHDVVKIRYLLKNESEKIKGLVQKVKLLKQHTTSSLI